MNEVRNVSVDTMTPKIITVQNPSFRAASTATKTNEIPNDQFVKDYEKAKRQAKRDKNLNTGVQIGVLTALLASVGMMGYVYFGKGTPKTVFTKISEKMPSLDSGCVNPKVKEAIERFVEILKIPKDVANHFKAVPPRFMIFYGPTGTGKTFSAQLVAKELNAQYGEIQFADLSSEYIGKTAVNISRKFKELKKLAAKNPDKQYVVAFNEIDSLLNNVNKLGANNQHLGQNRTAFLNGLDSVKDCKNLTIIGTTNVNPKSGNVDLASLGRAVIQEIKLPVKEEAAYALDFQLSKYGGTEELRKNKDAINNLAEQIVSKSGSNRDIEKIVQTATTDFVVKIGNKPDAKSKQITADYLQKVIDEKEIWASGIDDSAESGKKKIPEISDSVMAKFWEFIAKQQGAI